MVIDSSGKTLPLPHRGQYETNILPWCIPMFMSDFYWCLSSSELSNFSSPLLCPLSKAMSVHMMVALVFFSLHFCSLRLTSVSCPHRCFKSCFLARYFVARGLSLSGHPHCYQGKLYVIHLFCFSLCS